MDRLMFAVVALSSTVVFSGPIVFSERSEFENAFDNLVIESFEEPITAGSTVSFAGFSVTESSNFANIKSRTDYVSDGDQSIGFTWNGETQLVFEFNPPIDAFAVDVLDFGTCCSAETLDVTSDTGEISLVAAVGVDLPRGNLQFFGIQTDEPFSKLTFTSQSLSDNDLIVFDLVAFHAVPEPQIGTMMFGLMFGILFLGGTYSSNRESNYHGLLSSRESNVASCMTQKSSRTCS